MFLKLVGGGDWTLKPLTDTWVIENSLRLAAASLNRAAALNNVWHELADQIVDDDDFTDLDDD